MVPTRHLTRKRARRFRPGWLPAGSMLLVGISLLVGCESVPCRQASTLAEIRACYCDEGSPGEGADASSALSPAEQARFDLGLEGLGAPGFEDYARAGEVLVSLGHRAFGGLLCAPVILRESHGQPQDPVDRVLLVILADAFTPGERAALLTHADPMRRLYAVRSIRFRRATGEAGDLIAALDDQNYHVREEAIEALHALAGESRIRKPRNVLYQTPQMRQIREVKRWQSRWKREGIAMLSAGTGS